MKNINTFDVIGPNMIGPSSSHTAGAVRIARLARKIANGRVVSAIFTLYGSFALTFRGHGTDRALVAGILGHNPDDYAVADAFDRAAAANLQYAFIADVDKSVAHPNTVDILITRSDGKQTRLTAVSLGGGAVEIREINGIDVNITGHEPTLFIIQKNVPAVAAHITQCIGENQINIATMSIYTDDTGHFAYTIIETNSPVTDEIVDKIRALESIVDVMSIN